MIGRFEDKGRSHGQAGGRTDNRFHPYKRLDTQTQEQSSGKPAWKQLGCLNNKSKRGGRQSTSFPHIQPRVSSHINDNYCVNALRLLTRGKVTVDCVNLCQPHSTGLDYNRNRKNCCQSVSTVNCLVVNHAHIVQV